MRIQCSVCILLTLIELYHGAPADSKSARILKFDYDDSGKGPYRYGFQSDDGITKEESGEIHYAGTKNEFMKVTGVFSYPGPDGVMYEVRYTADDQGFHPEGDHIKVPPFVPWVHNHDDGSNDIGGDSANFESGQVITQVTTSKPSTEYLPSSATTYLPSTPTTPKPQYNSEENVLEPASNGVNGQNQRCLQTLSCGFSEQESFGSAPGASTVYLPSTVGPVKVDDARSQNILSTPRPNPEVHFHSTAEPQGRNFRSVTAAPRLLSQAPKMMLLIGPLGAQLIPIMK